MSLHVHINWPAWPLRLESFWLAWSQDMPAWVPTAGFLDGLLWPGVPEAIATTPFQVVKIRMQCLAETIKTKSSWHLVTCKRWKLEKYITKMRTRERSIINLIQSRPSLCSLVVAFQVEFHIILLHRYCVCVDLNPIPGTRTWWSITPMTSIAWWRLNFHGWSFLQQWWGLSKGKWCFLKVLSEEGALALFNGLQTTASCPIRELVELGFVTKSTIAR